MTEPTPRKTFTHEFPYVAPKRDENDVLVRDDDGKIVMEPGTRTIEFYDPTDGQLAQIARGASLLNRAADRNPRYGSEGIARVLNVIGKLVVDQDDHDWLEEGLTDGTIGLGQFTDVLEVIANDRNVTKKAQKSARSGRR